MIFPHNQMQILPYNRVLKDLNGWPPEQLLEMLGKVFVIDPQGTAAPARKHELGFYLAGQMAHAGLPHETHRRRTTRLKRST